MVDAVLLVLLRDTHKLVSMVMSMLSAVQIPRVNYALPENARGKYHGRTMKQHMSNQRMVAISDQ